MEMATTMAATLIRTTLKLLISQRLVIFFTAMAAPPFRFFPRAQGLQSFRSGQTHL